jgi:hypothetical protein
MKGETHKGQNWRKGYMQGCAEERERVLGEIWDMLITSMPKDAENLSTLTSWQKCIVLDGLLARLKDSHTEASK